MQLQFEIRKIEAFQINTRVLTASGGEIKLQLGRNMGIKKGDEYSIMVSETIEGFKNDSEKGLIQIKDVGSEISTGRIVYSDIKVTKDVQLKEIPRLGVDVEGYLDIASGPDGTVVLPGSRQYFPVVITGSGPMSPSKSRSARSVPTSACSLSSL